MDDDWGGPGSLGGCLATIRAFRWPSGEFEVFGADPITTQIAHDWHGLMLHASGAPPGSGLSQKEAEARIVADAKARRKENAGVVRVLEIAKGLRECQLARAPVFFPDRT